MNRRSFLKVLTATGAGLVIEIFAPEFNRLEKTVLAQSDAGSPTAEPPDGLQPNAYLKIGMDGIVTITVAKSEMGQGVRTALPMIIAEELGADWSTVRVEQAITDRAYGDQSTGGSTSVQSSYVLMRRAGATARDMLLAAAADTWGVDKKTCRAENGIVIQADSGQQLSFGSLVAKAVTMPIPKQANLKEDNNNRIVGTRVGRIDNPDIVTGKAVYGLDVQVPGMLYATVARCPVVGGKVVSFDDGQTRAVMGVRDVVQIGSGIAVVAENTWAAIKGRNALKVTWDEGENNTYNTTDAEKELTDLAMKDAPTDSNILQAVYVAPYLAHATMEPMNCVADVRADSCEIWAPTQDPGSIQQTAVTLTGLAAASVKVNVTLLGGGFGRRLSIGNDYAIEAIQISKAVTSPVQLVWTREDDMQHDHYHPLTVVQMTGSLDDPTTIAWRSIRAHKVLPIGPWRAVDAVADAFARECFMDEYAAATGVDPLDLRRKLLPDKALAVVELAAEKAGWGTPLAEGRGRGLAYYAVWDNSHVAMVAEVSVSDAGVITVHHVTCAIDCGLVINPDMVEAQMEGGIVFGLTAALKAPITVANGQVQQSNFHDYPLLRLDEMPQVEVYFVPKVSNPTGVGEMANPVISPAVANAVFAVTGKRLRRMPLQLA